MWIELSDDLEGVLCDISSPLSCEALAVNSLIDLMIKGKHIVYATPHLFEKIIELENINPSNKEFITWVLSKYSLIYDCSETLEFKILVSSKNTSIIRQDSIYYVPLSFFYHHKEAFLVSEHESDWLFYNLVFQLVKTHKKTWSNQSISLRNESCHGSNVGAKLLQCANDEDIALCVLDSDKETDIAHYGDTYIGAEKKYKDIMDEHVIYLDTLKVREKENLIPPGIYSYFDNNDKSFLNVLDEFIDDEQIISFFNIKGPIKYKYYKDDLWNGYYKRLLDRLIEESMFVIPQDDTDDIDNFHCLNGIGDKLCEKICYVLMNSSKKEDIIKQYHVSKEDIEKLEKMSENVAEEIPQYLYEEWERLSKLIFSWGCCVSEEIYPRYGSFMLL